MSTPSASPSVRDSRFAFGQAIGFAAAVWGYPLVETMRTCRLQTQAGHGGEAAWWGPVDRLHHVQRAATAADRDIVTPANDLLYTTAWINLKDGPRFLHVPGARRHPGRYFVLALYDAWTNNFANPGMRISDPDGELVALVGPDAPADLVLPAAARVLRSPTNLVWLISRVVVGEDDAAGAQALQADIRIECPANTDHGHLPQAVTHWRGEVEDTVAALAARPQDASVIAGHFFANLCLALEAAPPPPADAGLATWLASGKLVPGSFFDWALLDPSLRDGLQQGLVDAAAHIINGSRSRVARPWAAHFGLGRYGSHYLVRALTAYKGLGALWSEEAVYAMGDFDAEHQPLHGSHPYVLRFNPGDLPPVDAFWSLTLYDADRYLYANALSRYSLGDRTRSLKYDPDGGLTLDIKHEQPAETSNWLPAPKGSFYLILRMYCPRPEARTWRIPPVQRLHAIDSAG